MTRAWSPGKRCCRSSSRAANYAIDRYGRRSCSSARCGMTGRGIRCLGAPFRCLKKYGRSRRRRDLRTCGGVTSWIENTPCLVIRCKCGYALDDSNQKSICIGGQLYIKVDLGWAAGLQRSQLSLSARVMRVDVLFFRSRWPGS